MSALTSARWWFSDQEGRLVLGQLPNPALWVWLGAVVLGRFTVPEPLASDLPGVRHGALLVWGLDELVRGASPFRRVLGAVVLGAQLFVLVRG